ncbi:hypothetical protein U1Q18_039454 [Sarracenia purpurea var. burkii]
MNRNFTLAEIDRSTIEEENKDRDLKRLGFVRLIAINAVGCVSNLYEYAKQNSSPLKSTVGTIESDVATFVGPVYEKFKSASGDLLAFLDEMVLICVVQMTNFLLLLWIG